MTNNMTDQPEKFDLATMDASTENRAELLRLFPEAHTEGGKIDFDKLRLVLGEMIDAGRERYSLTWPGKAQCFKTIQAPSLATLRPAPNESVNWDTTENLIIEGDNLEVLKLLQKAYLGKIKMIYIDPPYNTGKDFIYPDNYGETLQTYLEYTGQVDSEGRKFGTNTETDGRFHSKWLNMMYPRLYLAQNLLKDDGVILISIDDAEVENLRRICSEIFGEENFIACMVWEKGRKNDAKLVSVGHEYLLIYARSLERLKELKTVWREEKPGAKEIWDEYIRLRAEYGDDDSKIEKELQSWFSSLPKNHPSKKWARYRRIDKNGPWRDDNISWPGGDGPRYDVIHPKTGKACQVPERGWVYATPETMQLRIAQGIVEFRDDHTEPPYRKSHIRPISYELADEVDDLDDDEDQSPDDELATQVRGSYFYKQSQVSVKYLRKLMGAKLFDNPKDHEEIKRLIQYVLGDAKSEIVLDFFAGSGTTAESVMLLNRETKADHKFVLVQLPQALDERDKSGKAALAAGFKTIADLTRERVRRAIKKIGEEESAQLGFEGDKKLDLGFRAYKLAESNFQNWEPGKADNTDSLGTQLTMYVNNIRDGRTESDILHELLLKSGFPLSTVVEKLSIAGKSVYSIGGGIFLVCLDKSLTLDVIRAMAEMKPSRVVCLDAGFAGDDQLKVNAVQTFKAKGVAKFQTV